jgi:hypothetical protein
VASKSGSVIARILPYVAVGGLLYLMAQNASKVKAAGSSGAAVPLPPAGSPTNNAGCNDFGVNNASCWCG